VTLQAQRAASVESALRMIHETGHDERLAPAWVEVIGRTLGPARFLWHGFQMLAAYLGQLAPEGRVAVVHLFQAADQMRRVHVVAERLALLRRTHPEVAAQSRAIWQDDRAWQPMRRALEESLVVWDHGEALVAFGVCLAPVADWLLLDRLAEAASAVGDGPLASLLFSLGEDARWHRESTAALVRVATGARPQAGEAARAWARRWMARALEAAGALAPVLDRQGRAGLPERLTREARRWLEGLGLAG
jgi:toluene monooxygenase system protein E